MFFYYCYCCGGFSSVGQECYSQAAVDKENCGLLKQLQQLPLPFLLRGPSPLQPEWDSIYYPNDHVTTECPNPSFLRGRSGSIPEGDMGLEQGLGEIKNTSRTKKWADQNVRQGNTHESPNQVVFPGRNQKLGQWARMMTTMKLAFLTSGTQWNAEQNEHNY